MPSSCLCVYVLCVAHERICRNDCVCDINIKRRAREMSNVTQPRKCSCNVSKVFLDIIHTHSSGSLSLPLFSVSVSLSLFSRLSAEMGNKQQITWFYSTHFSSSAIFFFSSLVGTSYIFYIYICVHIAKRMLRIIIFFFLVFLWRLCVRFISLLLIFFSSRLIHFIAMAKNSTHNFALVSQSTFRLVFFFLFFGIRTHTRMMIAFTYTRNPQISARIGRRHFSLGENGRYGKRFLRFFSLFFFVSTLTSLLRYLTANSMFCSANPLLGNLLLMLLLLLVILIHRILLQLVGLRRIEILPMHYYVTLWLIFTTRLKKNLDRRQFLLFLFFKYRFHFSFPLLFCKFYF